MNIPEILVALGAQVAQEVRTDNAIADGYVRSVAKLMSYASRWAAVSGSGIRCLTRFRNPLGEIASCDAAGIGACVACGRPTCFAHAMISPADGNMICFGCVGIAERAAKVAPDVPPAPVSDSGPVCSCANPWMRDKDCLLHGERGEQDQRKKHLKVLGLSKDANWLQIQAAYRRLAQEHHPDKVPAHRRGAAHQKMAKINKAFAWLKQRNKEAA